MNIYQSPLCSCIICNEVKSAKGIHSHYILHDDDSRNMHIARCKETAAKGAKSGSSIKHNLVKTNYSLNPAICQWCKITMSYEKRKQRYCSSSCSAKFSNSLRSAEHPSRVEGNKKRSTTMLNKKPQKCKVSFCTVCSSVIRNSTGKYCTTCLHQLRVKQGSISAKKYGFGGVRQSKVITYKGVKLGSSYELEVAMSLDSNNIKWTKSTKFAYTDPFDKDRTYEPDFYLPDYNVYLDPKNDFLINNINPALGFSDIEKIKIVKNKNSGKYA